MDDLNPKARALIDAGRGALRATAGDRDRIEAVLRARLGADAFSTEPSADVHMSSVGSALGRRLALPLAMGTVAVGLALLVLRPSAPPPALPAHVPVETKVAPAWSSAAGAGLRQARGPLDSGLAPVAAPADVASRSASSAHRRPDPLAQEVALLSRATAALRAGHAGKALRTLDEHQRRFPGGALREERRTAKAQALCLLGRTTEGRAELSLLPPRSPGADRAERACEVGAPSALPR